MFRTAVLLAASLCAGAASAQQWAEKMFAERSHDFGAVPRSAKTEFTFVMTNPFDSDVHLSSVHASCGCTMPRIVKDTIKPGEQGSIVAEFNTRAFTGQHGARVFVTIDRPQFAQVVLDVKGYIRTDIVVDPGQVNLGSVALGQAAQKTVRINYAGRGDWQITDVQSNSPFVSAAVKETSRNANRVSYELDVRLKDDAPSGYLYDQLQLTTNDRRSHTFPVIVEGRVVADLTVSPSALMLGTVQPGQKVSKQIVVKGSKPFKIVDIHCDNPAFSFAPSHESKALHLVPVTFEAGKDVGKIKCKIEIVTDLPQNNTAKLSAIGQITAPFAGK